MVICFWPWPLNTHFYILLLIFLFLKAARSAFSSESLLLLLPLFSALSHQRPSYFVFSSPLDLTQYNLSEASPWQLLKDCTVSSMSPELRFLSHCILFLRTTNYLVMVIIYLFVLLIFWLLPSRIKTVEGQDFYLFCFIFRTYLAHAWCSINICWMNEWIEKWLFKF